MSKNKIVKVLNKLLRLKGTTKELKEIITNFIFPLASVYAGSQIELDEAIEELFHVRDRNIEIYRAIVKFKMPGLYMITASVGHSELGNRSVGKGDTLFVRTDTTSMWTEVETESEQMFRLTQEDFARIRKYITPRKYKRRNRDAL